MAIRPIPQNRDEWLKLRRSFVGGSDVASLLGLQKDTRTSAFTLYHIKRGEEQEPDLSGDDRVEDGILFEDAIAQSAARREKWTLKPGVFATDDHCPGSAATLDRCVDPGPEDVANGFVGPGALEAKMVAWDVYMEDWLGDEPPFHIQLQLQQQLACTGWQWGAIVALVGGRYWCKRYMRDDEVISVIREKVTEFWEMVRSDTPPAVDHRKSTLTTLKHLYPRPDESKVIDMSHDNHLPELWDRCVRLTEERKRAEKAEDEAQHDMRQLLGPNKKFLLADGRTVYRSVGKDTEPRQAKPGELIPGRRGQDRLYFSKPKEQAA